RRQAEALSARRSIDVTNASPRAGDHQAALAVDRDDATDREGVQHDRSGDRDGIPEGRPGCRRHDTDPMLPARSHHRGAGLAAWRARPTERLTERQPGQGVGEPLVAHSMAELDDDPLVITLEAIDQ